MARKQVSGEGNDLCQGGGASDGCEPEYRIRCSKAAIQSATIAEAGAQENRHPNPGICKMAVLLIGAASEDTKGGSKK